MSLTIQQALAIGAAFRNEDLLEEVTGKGDHFKKGHIKALSPTDRKLCYRALSQIERASLNDFSPRSEPPAVDLTERVRDVTSAISDPIDTEDKSKPAWYKMPFIWIAKLVHSISLWFKNTFFGRISSDKLWNKVETYLNDVRLAHLRKDELSKDEGLLSKASEALETQAEEQKEFLEEFKILVEVREVLHFIDTIGAKDKKAKVLGLENFRADIQNTWIVGDINAGVIPTTNLKKVVKNEIDNASEEVQRYLNDLYTAAKSDDDNIEEVADLIQAAVTKLKSDLESEVVIGGKHHTHVKDADEHIKKLQDEYDLLTKKYPE